MIILQFSIRDVQLYLAGRTDVYPEFSGSLHIYTSSDLGRMKNKVDDKSPVLEQGIILEEPFSSEIQTLYLPDAKQVVPSSSLVISLYAHSESDGNPYLVSCGSFALDLVANTRKSFLPKMVRVSLQDPHPKSPIEKGTLVLTIHSVVWNIAKEIDYSFWRPITTKQEKEWREKMDSYIMRSLNVYLTEEEEERYDSERPRWRSTPQKFVPSHPNLRRIHCPYYQMDFIGKRLPGFAYCWQMPREEPNEEYFINLIQCALQVYEMGELVFLNAIEQQFKEENDKVQVQFKLALDVIAGACSLYSQGQLYVPDHVNTHVVGKGSFDSGKNIIDVENMNNVRVTRGNDCEDLGDDNLITAMTLRNYEKWTHPLLLACRRVLQQFFPLLPHGAVATASASQTITGTPPSTDFVAHIFCLLIPIERVKIMLGRTGNPPDKLGLTQPSPLWNANLDVLFCEGTGRVSPILRPEWEWKSKDRTFFVETVKTQLDFENSNAKFASFNILQVPYISHPKNTYEYNSFYRYIIASYVPMLPGSTVGDIAFVYPKEGKYGVLIHDLVYDINEPGIAIIEVLQDDEKKYITDSMTLAHPIPQLYPRNIEKVKEDIQYLENELKLIPWDKNSDCKHFGYFFTMAELRKDKNIVKFEGPYKSFYKYIGLDDLTAYIELCVCTK